MFMSLGAAAKQAGLSKATISRAIKDGKLTAERNPETNGYRIDPSELHRYTEAQALVRNTVANAGTEHSATGGQPAETPQFARLEARCDVAEAKLVMAEQQLADLRRLVEDLRGDRDEWRSQAQRIGLALPRPEERRRRWWWRRAG